MARPRTNPAAHRKNIALTLPPDLILKAKACAEISGVSVSEMVEVALTSLIVKVEKRLEEKHLPKS
jgi:hypothetical protein